MLRTACRDDRHEELLGRDGFVVVEILDADSLARVRARIRELGFGEDDGRGFPVPRSRLRVSLTQGDAELAVRIFDEVSPLLRLAADRLLDEYALLRIAVFDKLSRGEGIGPHQHATIVDESTCRSLTIWLPLTDTSIEMGTLHVVEGSHEFTHGYRPKNRVRDAFAGVSRRVLARYSTALPLRAGQAVLFDDRLIHWSPPNRSSRPRTALQLELIPEEAELVMYYRTRAGDLAKYAVDRSLYRRDWLNQEDAEKLTRLEELRQPEIRYGNRQFLSMVRPRRSSGAPHREPLLPAILGRIRDRIGL